MARRVELGAGPVNPMERETVRLLVDQLPNDGWTVIPNASLPDPKTGHAYEYDAIVVAPHAVYVIEMKGWRGTIREVGRSEWELGGGRVERNPLPLVDHKARVLAALLRKDLGRGRTPYVQACLVCGSDDTTFEIYGMDARRCLRPSELVAYLRDPRQIQSALAPADYSRQHGAVVKVVTGPLVARQAVGRRYGSFVTTDLQERDDERAVWLGRHAMLDDGRLVRIRAWYLSSYDYTEAQRAEEAGRRMRAAEALSRVGAHPRVATLRDFGEQDGEFYEVTDWSEHGTLLTAFVKGALHRMPVEHRIRVVRDIAEALAAAQAHGVFHRALSPEAVLLDADGRARLTGFDLAFLEGAKRTVYGVAPHPHREYLAPELQDLGDYEVFDNTDLYALAKLARHLFGKDWPEPVGSLLEQCLADDPAARPANPAAFLATLEAAPEPDASPAREEGLEREPSELTFSPGDTIDGVNTVLDLLGRGAAGTVYRVTNEPLGAELALKLVTDPPDGYDAAAEFRLLKAVSSPHVPRAHWLGRIDRPGRAPAPYLLLDLVDGERLSDVVRRGPVPVDQALHWTDDLLDALGALHAAGGTGVLHRDVKADNVVVGPHGAVLVDFGSAREGADAGSAPEGTLRISPPDLAATGWEPQADVYAAACVAYEMLAGRPPFAGVPGAERAPERLDLVRREVPGPVADVIAQALAPRREDRFADATSLRTALGAAQRPRTPRTGTRVTLSAVVEEAGDVLWTAQRVQALTNHPDVQVPLALALQACIVPPADDSPEAAREALLASEARAMALERPLPEAMPRVYDALVGGLLPAPLDAPEDGDSAAGLLDPAGETALWFDALHFTEWARIAEVARSLGRSVRAYAWAAGSARGPAGVFSPAPTVRMATLLAGDRAKIELGALMVARRQAIDEALLGVLDGDRTVWVGAAAGLVYLGHGLRRDVGEGLDAGADAARAAWAAAFPDGRAGPLGGALPGRVREPVRVVGDWRVPVGRLAWPDPPGTPWLQRGGGSVPEHVIITANIQGVGGV